MCRSASTLRSHEIMDLIRDELASLRRRVQPQPEDLGLAKQPESRARSAGADGFLHQAGMPASLRALLLDTVKDMRDERDALAAVRSQLEQALQREPAAVPRRACTCWLAPRAAANL
jgi:LmbE family N-acetylglucosaminyl deacetylase